MAYVIKIKYEDSLRRVTWENESRNDELSFARLEGRIRELFALSSAAEVLVTYVDKDGDVVTMANDHDLKDALVHQSLNPLRLHVSLVNSNLSNSAPVGDGANDASVAKLPENVNSKDGAPEKGMKVTDENSKKISLRDTDVQLLQILKKAALAADMQSVKQLLQSVEPLLQKVSPAQSLMENVAQTIISRPQFSAPVTSSSPLLRSDTSKPSAAAHPGAVSSEESKVGLRAVADSPVEAQGTLEKESTGRTTEKSNVVHHGVICDICGVTPIVGHRWKSIRKHDYDLCPSCFEKHGNVNEYTKIDQQMFRPRHVLHPRRSMASYPPAMGPTCNPHIPLGSVFHGPGTPPARWGGMRGANPRRLAPRTVQSTTASFYGGKLDARFVRDVTIFDGTELAPGTKFTKIWRLRNSGAGTWPSNTVLVHVGGDDFGPVSMTPLELPPQGFAPEGEIDASVDFTAPEKPGRYCSYWRLQASPYGPKFGHRVWVLIQVVPEDALDQAAESLPSLNDAPAQETKSVTDGVSLAEADLAKSAARFVQVVPQDALDQAAESLPSVNDAPAQETKSVTDGVSLAEADLVKSAARVDVLESKAIANDAPAQEVISVAGGVPNSKVATDSPILGQSKLDESKLEDALMQFDNSTPDREVDLKSEIDRTQAEETDEVAPTVEISTLGDEFSMVDRHSDTARAGEARTEGENLTADSKLSAAKSDLDGEEYFFKFGASSSPANLQTAAKSTTLPEQTQAENQMPHAPTTAKVPVAAIEEDLSSVEGLLTKLQAMGFTDGKLNFELLEKNGMDLRKTLDDLCAAEEWDPILEELEEMGFYDTDMNRRLMFKNNGSVKRVVKDLVQMDRQISSGKGKKTVE